MNIQQLRERYAAPEIPKCRVCGGVLTVQRAGGGPTIWGCTGMIDDPTGERNWIYAEGRSCADEHYERSRWSDYRQGGDADVIELIDALEAAEREREELKGQIDSGFWGKMAAKNLARAKKAEAELTRRDAAAGERAGVVTGYAVNGCVVSGNKLSIGDHVYTAAQPAVLPPKLSMDIDPEIQGEFRVHEAIRRKGFNQALDAALALGAQQQNVVELYKRKSMEVISGQRYSYVLLEDLLPELDAANVKWEVKK